MSRRTTDHPSARDDSAWLSARIAPDQTAIFYHGTEGNDRLFGSNFDDYFDVSQGGDDRVTGRNGDDVIYFGAAFTGADRADGGYGEDMVILDGSYFEPIVIGKSDLVNVELLGLNRGSFEIAGYLNFMTGIGYTEVDATSLTKHQSLNLAVKSAGFLNVHGGEGDDVIHAAINHRQSALSGNGGDDVLIGEGSQTYFYGGVGADHIVVTNGKDYLSYTAVTDSTPDRYDTIDGFKAEGDRSQNIIRFYFDSDTTTDGFQTSFHLGETANRVGDVVAHYDEGLGQTIIDVFTDHDDAPDFALHLTGNVTLTAHDFYFG